MNILFTGASSFTGLWFIKELHSAGHHVFATFTQIKESYNNTGIRAQRVSKVLDYCTPLFNCPIGSPTFLEAVKGNGPWDLFCHHGADVTNYNSPNFDYIKATQKNTLNIKTVFESLYEKGCRKVLLTGSVFEPREGAGTQPLEAFSPYGISKAFTADLFSYHCSEYKMDFGKFVIPNPFGPFEEPRFISYLINSWLENKTPAINCPDYVRDNIPVSFLSKKYLEFVESLFSRSGKRKCSPSGYVEKLSDFAYRLSKEMQPRLELPCEIEIKKQTDFSQPLERYNTESIDFSSLEAEEEKSWKDFSNYYNYNKNNTLCLT